MIIGYGIDLIDIRRVEKTINKFGKRFINRIFTKGEIIRSDNRNKRIDSYAKRFAAKEAFSKALGTGISNGINFNEIVILNKKSGKPYINIIGETKKILKKKFKRKKSKISLSLSDEKKYAVAFVTISLWRWKKSFTLFMIMQKL